MRKFFSVLCLTFLMVSLLTAAAPTPNTSFTLVQELPATMNVGDIYTVIVQVESDQEFISAMALPSFQFPGKGVIAVQGGDRAGRGTSATLEVTFKAKGSTANFPSSTAPVFVVVGVRYAGGLVVVQEYTFQVTVP